MRIGRLKHHIEVQSQSNLTDDYGEEVQTYNKVFSSKCNFKVLSGVEQLKSGLALSTEVATILMRNDKRLMHDHLVLFNGNRYEVAAIKPTESGMQMVVTVSRQIL